MATKAAMEKYAKSLGKTTVYTPITLNGKLIQDSNRRKHKNQHHRINAITSKIKDGTTFLDLGCNTGYLLKEIMKIRNVKGTGVDCEEDLIELCKINFELEKIDAKFLLEDIFVFVQKCIDEKIQFDYVSMTSVFEFEPTMMFMDTLLKITRRRLFFEATNHKKYTIEQQKHLHKNSKLSEYRHSLLSVTDYQDRLLYVIFKKLDQC